MNLYHCIHFLLEISCLEYLRKTNLLENIIPTYHEMRVRRPSEYYSKEHGHEGDYN